MTIHILQDLPFCRIKVKVCRMLRSKIPAFCGNADHQTILSGDVWIQRPKPIMPAECRRMWDTQSVMISKTAPGTAQITRTYFDLKIGGKTQITYESHGTSWWFPGSLFRPGGQVECNGASYWSEGQQRWMHQIVQTVCDDITVKEVSAIVDLNSVSPWKRRWRCCRAIASKPRVSAA